MLGVQSVLGGLATGLAGVNPLAGLYAYMVGRIDEQLGVTGVIGVTGNTNPYAGDHRVGAAIRRAYDDAVAWVAASRDQVRRDSS